MKKCTPFSNTECRKRAPSPTEASPARPTPTPTSPPDIGNWTSLFHAKPSAQHYFKRRCTSLLIYFYFFSGIPVVISLVIIIVLVLIGLAVWWFIVKQHSCEIPCELTSCSVPLQSCFA